MYKCETCSNYLRCTLPEKCTETSEICDCYLYEDDDDNEVYTDYDYEGIEINLIFNGESQNDYLL